MPGKSYGNLAQEGVLGRIELRPPCGDTRQGRSAIREASPTPCLCSILSGDSKDVIYKCRLGIEPRPCRDVDLPEYNADGKLYHNVYIEPGSYEIYKKTGVFPEGTSLQLTLPAQSADGSRTEPSGRGFFPGAYNGADVTVKDTKRFTEMGGWGYFNFHHYEPKAATARVN